MTHRNWCIFYYTYLETDWEQFVNSAEKNKLDGAKVNPDIKLMHNFLSKRFGSLKTFLKNFFEDMH